MSGLVTIKRERNVIVDNTSPTTVIKTEPRGSVLVEPQSQNHNSSEAARVKRRINFYGGVQPASVARRNARERNRVKQVNNGFATLRNHIPISVAAALGVTTGSGRGASKKLSKVETLRMAVEYIRSLQDLLEESGGIANENYYKDTKLDLSPPCSDSGGSSSASPGYIQETQIYHQQAPTPQPYRGTDYEPMSPEDEELLDVISWWQQSQ